MRLFKIFSIENPLGRSAGQALPGRDPAVLGPERNGLPDVASIRQRWRALRETARDRALEWSLGGMASGALAGFLGTTVFPPHWVGDGVDQGAGMLIGAFGTAWLCEGAAYLSGAPEAWGLLRERFAIMKTSTTEAR